jgi:uncharacterized protein (DUF362 family)
MGFNSFLLTLLGGYIHGAPSFLQATETTVDPDSVVISQNGSPTTLVNRAIEAFGGIEKFVGNGERVLIKPNASFNYEPEKATTTNPEVASAVIDLCFQAGASEVFLADHLLMTPASRTISNNGLKYSAENHGAEFKVLEKSSDFQKVNIEGSKVLKEVDIASLYFDCDVFINLPIFKHHSSTGSSLGMKNLMGLIWDRQALHRYGLEECIADLNLAIKPDITIIDATRALMTNGPRGPGDVKEIGQIIAGVDPVAVDVAALSIGKSYGYDDFSLNGIRNRYIDVGAELGIGDGNPDSVAAKTVILDAGALQTTNQIEPVDVESRNGLPDWVPFASLSAASVALGFAAMLYSKRRTRIAREERR